MMELRENDVAYFLELETSLQAGHSYFRRCCFCAAGRCFLTAITAYNVPFRRPQSLPFGHLLLIAAVQ